MTVSEAITIAERYDVQIRAMEDKAIARLNRALESAYGSLEKDLVKSYGSISSNATLLQSQRRALILQELGGLLQIVDPDKADDYEANFAVLLRDSTNAGFDVAGLLAQAMGNEKIKPLSDIAIEAVAASARGTYQRLSRYGNNFADTATNIISQGIAQGWSVQRVLQPLQQQLGVTKQRAEMIARTEAISAYNDAANERYAKANIEGVMWIAIGDRRTCFPAGTMIKTIEGDRPIETIKEGDKVLTRFGYRKVVKTLSRQYRGQMTEIELLDRSLVLTSNHPVWTPEGWTEAEKIKPGCIVQLDDKSLSEVVSVKHFCSAQVSLSPITVYNLTVEEHPEYYAEGILVHNCGYCLNRHLQVYPRGSMRPPLHPYCVTGDSLVLSDRVKNVTRRYYSGDIFIIETASGNKLTITPNHPALTTKGWIKPKLLMIGDDLISCLDAQRMGKAFGYPDDNQRPTTIEEVFTAFSKSSNVTTAKMPVTAEHFHGDFGNRESNVDIVNTNGLLGGDMITFLDKPMLEQGFIGSVRQSKSLFSNRSFDFAGFATSSVGSLNNSPACLGVLPILIKRSLAHHQLVSLGLRPDANTSYFQNFSGCIASNAVLRRDRIFRSATNVIINQLLLKRLPLSSFANSCPFSSVDFGTLNTSISESSTKAFGTDSDLPGSIFQRFAGLVQSDRIINITKANHNDYVYNLETEAGYYTANNIIIHNCRCTLAPWQEAWRQAGIIDINTLAEARDKAIAEATIKPSNEPAPFEKIAGVKRIASPIYTPVFTPRAVPTTSSGSGTYNPPVIKPKVKRARHKD